MAEPNLRRQWRHVHSDRWHRAKEVKKRQEVETLWGTAWAEVGTYLMTDKESGDMCIATLEDLQENWTNDPLSKPPKPGEAIMHTVIFSDEPSTLPGSEHAA